MLFKMIRNAIEYFGAIFICFICMNAKRNQSLYKVIFQITPLIRTNIRLVFKLIVCAEILIQDICNQLQEIFILLALRNL